MSDLPITQCITMGRRPDLLQQTLESLSGLPRLRTLAINDFGDPETTEAFRQVCPWGEVVGPGHRLGHHPAVDELYRHVETPYIFHNEDDWQFTRTDFLEQAITLLEAEPLISAVCLRDTMDMVLTDSDRALVVTEERGGIQYQRLDALHKQWHGYTFNPHLSRLSTWRETGGFSQYEKERHLSRALRAKGYYVAFMQPPACHHIGDGRSYFYKPPGFWKRLSRKLRGRA